MMPPRYPKAGRRELCAHRVGGTPLTSSPRVPSAPAGAALTTATTTRKAVSCPLPGGLGVGAGSRATCPLPGTAQSLHVSKDLKLQTQRRIIFSGTPGWPRSCHISSLSHGMGVGPICGFGTQRPRQVTMCLPEGGSQRQGWRRSPRRVGEQGHQRPLWGRCPSWIRGSL